MKKKIYDCSTFFKGNLLFETRLRTLDSVVDYFIVCEATKTHTGKEKNLNFNYEKFKKMSNKIRYLVVDDMPSFNNDTIETNQYKLLNYQINKLHDGISEADKNDIIILSDEDEIPRPERISEFNYEKYKYGYFLQNMYYYKINIHSKTQGKNCSWPGSRLCLKKNLKSFSWFKHLKSKNAKKPFWKIFKEKSIQLIDDGGWHFTYLMSYKDIADKIKSSAHYGENRPQYTDIELIKKRVENLKDPFDRNFLLEKIKIDKTYPEFILKNINLFQEWILK